MPPENHEHLIDLHTHTTASDGSLAPAELIARAAARGLRAVAITDHDTVEGLPEAREAAAGGPCEFVPGIEISAEHPDSTLHILGYYMDWNDPEFLKRISVLQQARAERNPQIIRRLQDLGIDIDYEEVCRQAVTGQVGRPHFAQVLIGRGYVKTGREAFDRYLKKGAPAHVEKFRFPIPEAIGIIAAAGGIPVLAHPTTIACGAGGLRKLVADMVDCGLRGIEVHYPDHTPSQVRRFRQIARHYDLLITGGSDFHGSNIPGLELGTGRGSLRVPGILLEGLKAARTS